MDTPTPMKYVVLYEQGPTSFGASVPDLPGCVAVGRTRADVERLIREAISLHIAALRADGQDVPEPQTEAGVVDIKATA